MLEKTFFYIFLYNVSVNLSGHQSLSRLIKSHPGFAAHAVTPVFIVGNPMCVFEQRWRWAGPLGEKDRFAHVNRFAQLGKLIEYSIREYGEDNVRLFADLSKNPRSSRQDSLVAQIFSVFGCEAPGELKMLPKHPLIFGSKTGRHLYSAYECRHNSWPYLDENAYLNFLYKMDEEWGNQPFSPLGLRIFLGKEGASSQALLERMLELDRGSLDAPEWLLKEDSGDFSAPLAMEQLEEFVGHMPRNLYDPLKTRLRNDRSFLSEDQKLLLEAFEKQARNEFVHIGDLELPIELTVLTMTYNHEKYIGECMDSVLAQKTDFPVRHLVLDHCSGDSTPKIINEYAKKHDSIHPVLLNEHVPNENVYGLLARCKTRYAALCDGDDYFTNQNKLQIQVDFLEAHQDAALVFHPVKVIFEDSSHEPFYFPPPDALPGGMKEEYSLADLCKGNFIQTNSVVYRWRFTEGLPEWFRPDLCPGDWYWHLLHAEKGKIGFIPRIMSAYRRHKNALYANSFKNALEHRRSMGMAELETYKVVNDHFGGRYFRNMASLANGVFVNFLDISIKENDNSLLCAACNNYPQFGKFFLKSIEKIN